MVCRNGLGLFASDGRFARVRGWERNDLRGGRTRGAALAAAAACAGNPRDDGTARHHAGPESAPAGCAQSERPLAARVYSGADRDSLFREADEKAEGVCGWSGW